METLFQDLRYGIRALLKSPGFTAVAGITLALGIGANTAIFSVVNGVLLKSLPYKNPEHLALIRLDWRGVTGRAELAPAEVLDFREQARLCEGFEVISPNNISLTGEEMEKIRGMTISQGFIPLLGIQPVLGRNLSEKEEKSVLISYELWQRRFGGDKRILERDIEINNFKARVAGVMPQGFRLYLGPGTNVPAQIDLYFLGSFSEGSLGTSRNYRGMTTVTRLKPGVTFEQAQSEIDAVSARWLKQYPKVYENGGVKFHLTPLHQDLVQKVKPTILVLLGAVSFVLLIACTNVANLLLTRTNAREKELAIRCALGAGRKRILRQLVTENLLLTLVGGASGLLVAVWGINLLLFLRPADLPRQEAIGIDGPVLAATLVVSLLAGITLGLIPAWQATKADLNEGLKDARRLSGSSKSRLRNVLVISEVALSFVLLVGAGLMIRTFRKLNRVDLGFNSDQVLTLQVNLRPSSFTSFESRWQFYQQALEKVRALPGVESTSGINPLPLSGVELIDSYALNETTEVSLSASFHTVLPDYFRSMKIRMLAGRDFTPIDNEQKLPLAIIDETLVKQEWPNENPLGRKILLWPRTERQRWTEIVGVVEHVKAGGFQEDGRPQIYLPYLSYPLFDLTLIARTKTEPLMLASVMKKEVENLGTQRPVHTIRALNEYVSDQLAKTRFALVLISILASIALILCLVGLYSVIAYSVKQRTHEIGIRLALGAQACDVLGLVLRQGLVLITVGVGAGLTGALALTRLMLSLLYEVKPTDTATFVGVALLLTAVAVIACWLPARRASRVDPMVALRYE